MVGVGVRVRTRVRVRAEVGVRVRVRVRAKVRSKGYLAPGRQPGALQAVGVEGERGAVEGLLQGGGACRVRVRVRVRVRPS